MPKKQKKKLNIMLVIVVIVSIATSLAYPSAKKLLGMVHTYSRPAEFGKETIYSYIEEGDIHVADQILDDTFEISRFEPVKIEHLTWNEDPYSDIFWRFNFYNLEPARDLLYAWLQTGQDQYKEKLIEITESFLMDGMDGPYSWDYHGTAFRTMTLINIRAKLQKNGQLEKDFDEKIKQALRSHGEFLADPAHFEKYYNHGLDQAAALYLLAINHPELPGAERWLDLSKKRLVSVISGIIDEDGILVENSPYYHLYVLEKYYEINKYLNQHDLAIEKFSQENLDKMISYVVYMLQPDLGVPTIGASIGRTLALSGIYKEIAASHPELLYVLTQGSYGERPSGLNVHYPASGQTIMRSGWERGTSFTDQTQLIFDVGNYRTNHSDLDALSFSLFGKGIALMPDAGLYSYQPGPYRSYFHGTRAHNTVVVDGKDQQIGESNKPNKVSAGFFEEGPGYASQSARSELYDGVVHKRAITLIEESTIIIIDKLESDQEHLYEQMFHLFPGAEVTTDGVNISAFSKDRKTSLSIEQFVAEGLELKTAIGQEDPPAGLCSTEYNVALPCRSLSFAKKGKNALYVSVVSINKKADVIFKSSKNSLTVYGNKGKYTININETADQERHIETDKKYDMANVFANAQEDKQLNELEQWQKVDEDEESGGSIGVNKNDKTLEVTTPVDGSAIKVLRNAKLDLSNKNISFMIKIDDTQDLKGFNLHLSNNNWEKEAYFYAKGGRYDINRDNEWLRFGVGKGDLRKMELGNWIKSDSSFDWSRIDSVYITLRSQEGSSVKAQIKDFLLVPDQEEARAVIVFDDGWLSVMDAAATMNKYGIKGNVGLITDSVGKKNYLSLDDIKLLQNDYGWNMANHSSTHNDAVESYVEKGNISSLDVDVVNGLQFLIQNKINSAPNWYIYPDGRTDGTVKEVIGKYYKFARATNYNPESFPFPDPLEVSVFPVYSDRTTPLDVHNAVSDALKYNQTLFLMFHRISKGQPEFFTQISQKDFDQIIEDINRQGIKVVTLSELDEENGISQTEFALDPAAPGQFDLDVYPNYNFAGSIHAILY